MKNCQIIMPSLMTGFRIILEKIINIAVERLYLKLSALGHIFMYFFLIKIICSSVSRYATVSS